MASPLERLRKQAPQAAELAVLASLAARVDRVLLRGLRLELLPAADATAESDLWFSDVVARRAAGEIVLRADQLAVLRAALVKSGQLQRARAIARATHASAPPLLRLEEDLIFFGLSGKPAAMIEQRLGEAVATMRADKDRALDIAGWALHALPRLPESVRATAAAWSLAFAAEGELGYRITLGDKPPADGLFVSESTPNVPLAVGCKDRRLLLGVEDGPAIQVPATTPRIVAIESASGREVLAIEPGRMREAELPEGEVVLTNLRGERWRVRFVGADPARQTQDLSASENGFWILVDGTVELNLPARDYEVACAIGRLLAQAGFSLVTLGQQGVSYVVAQEFLKVLFQQGYRSGRSRLLQVVAAGQEPDFKRGGQTLHPAAAESPVSVAMAPTDAVLLIGRSPVTQEILGRGQRAGLPVAHLVDRADADANLAPPLPLEPSTWNQESAQSYGSQLIRWLNVRLDIQVEDRPPPLQDLLHLAARILDEPTLLEFEERAHPLWGIWRPIPTELADTLMRDVRRPSHRFLGYLATPRSGLEVLHAALETERHRLQKFQDARLLWIALLAAGGSADETGRDPRSRATAAACAVIDMELDANPRIEAYAQCKKLLQDLRHRSASTSRAASLAYLATRYVEIRSTTEAGDLRTAAMEQIVNEISGEFAAAPAMPEAEIWWSGGSAGSRLVGLGLLLGAPDKAGYPIVEEGIASALSPFEQFTALRVAQALLEQLERTDLQRLRRVLIKQRSGPPGMISQSDLSRWSISAVLLRLIENQLDGNSLDVSQTAQSTLTAESSPKLKPDFLIVCVLAEQLRAVLTTFEQAAGGPPRNVPLKNAACFDLGMVKDARVFAVMPLEDDASAREAALPAMFELLRSKAVILLGLAAGRNRKEQAIGDVLVATEVIDYALDARRDAWVRTQRFRASPDLFDKLLAVGRSWRGAATVHFGKVIALNLLPSTEDLAKLDKVLVQEKLVVGQEMEEAGIYPTMAAQAANWIAIRGISDWAGGAKADQPEGRRLALQNAAEFLLHALTHAPSKPAT